MRLRNFRQTFAMRGHRHCPASSLAGGGPIQMGGTELSSVLLDRPRSTQTSASLQPRGALSPHIKGSNSFNNSTDPNSPEGHTCHPLRRNTCHPPPKEHVSPLPPKDTRVILPKEHLPPSLRRNTCHPSLRLHHRAARRGSGQELRRRRPAALGRLPSGATLEAPLRRRETQGDRRKRKDRRRQTQKGRAVDDKCCFPHRRQDLKELQRPLARRRRPAHRRARCEMGGTPPCARATAGDRRRAPAGGR